jgi:hypothetical protein
MNQQYQELAEQAGLKVESWMTNPPKPFQILGSTEQFEQFAELIVRECAKISLECGINLNREDFRQGIARNIKQHFGVEE